MVWPDGYIAVLRRAEDVQAELKARGLRTGMDEAESRAELIGALLMEENIPSSAVLPPATLLQCLE